MPLPSTIVIVGAGLAAVTLVQALRRLDYAGELVVLSGEDALPYDRPPLSKDVLRGERDAPLLVEAADWADLKVDLRLGRRAVAVDPQERVLQLDDGACLSYDALVVATGAVPRHLPELTGDGVHVLRTRDEATALGDAIRAAGRLVIVGGGFIGCEVAASARALGADVVLLEVLGLPLVRALGPVVAAEVTAMHVAAGVDVRAGTAITAVHGTGADRQLELSDGTTVPGDVVLVGIGVTADTDWLAGSGITLADGVLCDAGGRSSVPGVWAVGDASRWWLPALSAHRRIEHWTNAMEQAEVVAGNLLGADAEHDPVPYVWSQQYGVLLQVAGLPAGEDDVTVLRVGPAADRLTAVYGRDGRCTGVLVGGAPRVFNRLRKLLATGASYDEALISAAL